MEGFQLFARSNAEARKKLHKMQRANIPDDLLAVIPVDPIPQETIIVNQSKEVAVPQEQNSLAVELPKSIEVRLVPLKRGAGQSLGFKDLNILKERAFTRFQQLGFCA